MGLGIHFIILCLYTFKYSSIDVLHVAAGDINVSTEKEIKARVCQAHLIINIWAAEAWWRD